MPGDVQEDTHPYRSLLICQPAVLHAVHSPNTHVAQSSVPTAHSWLILMERIKNIKSNNSLIIKTLNLSNYKKLALYSLW